MKIHTYLNFENTTEEERAKEALDITDEELHEAKEAEERGREHARH